MRRVSKKGLSCGGRSERPRSYPLLLMRRSSRRGRCPMVAAWGGGWVVEKQRCSVDPRVTVC